MVSLTTSAYSDRIANRIEAVANHGKIHSNYEIYRVGSLLVHKSRKLAVWGYNFHKTHTKSSQPFKYVHAEFSAIMKAQRYWDDLEGSYLFVARWRRDNILGMSKPCEFCSTLIKKIGVREVYWSTLGGFDGFRFY